MSGLFKRIALAAALGLLSAAACAQGYVRERSPLLYAVTAKHGATVYLFGTVHVGNTAIYPLPPAVEAAFNRSSKLALELDPTDEDVAQEAILKAFAALSSFRAESKFSTWLIQITINEARMKRRKDRANLYESIDEGKENDEGDYIPRDFADWREIPSEALQRSELRTALQNAIAGLGEKYREVFVMRDVQHMSISETAQALGINEALVKTRLLRARLQLRDALAPGIDGSWSASEGNWKKVRPW